MQIIKAVYTLEIGSTKMKRLSTTWHLSHKVYMVRCNVYWLLICLSSIAHNQIGLPTKTFNLCASNLLSPYFMWPLCFFSCLGVNLSCFVKCTVLRTFPAFEGPRTRTMPKQ